MSGTLPGFRARLATALTGAPETPLLFLGNFEVEQQWAKGEHTLPRLSAATANAVVNHMDEFALFLGGGADHVVLKTRPDDDYLDFLAGLGVDLPRIHVPGRQDPQRTVTEDALDDPALLAALSALAGPSGQGCQVTAHGISADERRFAKTAGLPLAGPGPETCKAVNSKVYSRRVADELGLRQPRGWACETLDELAAAFAAATADTGSRYVVKEAFGVSGKGIAVLESPRRADRILGMVRKQAERSENGSLAFVVEEWVAKETDLNYQFTVGRDGGTHFDFVKEQLTEGGVHKGHRMPARLTPAQRDAVVDAAERLGKRLAGDGYFGVVGVDAMLDPEGGLYPVVEINARHNMSTYQVGLEERFVGEGRIAVARHYPLRLTTPLSFAETRTLLDGLLFDPARGSGLLVNNHATVNAGFAETAETAGHTVDGRLYGVLVAESDDRVGALDTEIAARLAARKDNAA
ncbi:ATP-grasp domain-containing protein [Streptomyces venezuelae]|uniref:preATP grasp domain-containing protein n=1 Tax=Streptomyces venezuelae TaxID=54571 RepID=UPI00123A4564|nr:ATP-grasp domain-containing protein [Streptomyces venezuelae]QES09330.1 ATP-grasp domain-containing protein [Streptomyces venezuelae]